MVLLAAAICTKGGKALVSRQFVEMTKSRIEGLLAAFPKLLSGGSTAASAAPKQHTFVETESVRYVYQPLEKLYMLLVTTKASNILEDLETLRLFSRVIPEYCRNIEEADVLDNAFELIFAFDEIVALGYRESVNLAQIRTYVEMDSQEAKIHLAMRQNQEREAKQKMREKAKELQKQRLEAAKKGSRPSTTGFGRSNGYDGISSDSHSRFVPPMASSEPVVTPKPAAAVPKAPSGPSKALKLGGKGKDADSFVDQLKSEGERISSAPKTSAGSTNKTAKKAPEIERTEPPSFPLDSIRVLVKLEEKINLQAGRDGGVQSMEVHGIMMLSIHDEAFGCIKLRLENNDKKGFQLQTHPNVDKEAFKNQNILCLKNVSKPFPMFTEVGVLKWRLQTQDEAAVPLTINCWPSENGSGGCDVNIEYELQDASLELLDVTIVVPIAGNPVVSSCDGDYESDPRKGRLVWSLAVIDAAARSGSLEFSTNAGTPEDFFPVSVSFSAKKSYMDLKVSDVVTIEGENPVKYAKEISLHADKYEFV
ncbi:unnamed protein product [Notodromas monacha]|uniref:Coatomer subunit delta n=1 Tax=Notodromas monacha TaxID=399045 RepID=A0A7R9BEV0_9CRUS|nr:unnamed protein product [Notodromas monacha]CAG0914065.1 unnamed protein product [Notodromas monacha]